jgi:hypothetical protein
MYPWITPERTIAAVAFYGGNPLRGFRSTHFSTDTVRHYLRRESTGRSV